MRQEALDELLCRERTQFELSRVGRAILKSNPGSLQAARIGTYTGLYCLFPTLSTIAGPNVNGRVVQLTGGNYNNIITIVAPVFMVVTLGLMLGGIRGESVVLAPAG